MSAFEINGELYKILQDGQWVDTKIVGRGSVVNMNRNFSSALGSKGSSVRGAGSVAPAGATFNPGTIGGNVGSQYNTMTTPVFPGAVRPPRQASQPRPDECTSQGGSWQLRPGSETDFTCVLPMNHAPTVTPVFDPRRLFPPNGTGDGTVGRPNGTGDGTAARPTGTGDGRTTLPSGTSDGRGAAPGTGDTSGRPPSGTGDRTGGTSGTGDRTGATSGTGDRTGTMPGLGDRFIPPAIVTGDYGVPRSDQGDWCPPGYVPALNADFCPPEYLRSVYQLVTPPPDWRKDPYWGSTFNSRYVPAPVGGVQPSLGWAPATCQPGYAPAAPPPFQAAVIKGAGAVYETSDSTATLIAAAALAAGAYVGWKLGGVVQSNRGSRESRRRAV